MMLLQDEHGRFSCTECPALMFKIEQLQREKLFLMKELDLYRTNCKRPKVLKEVIHHPSRPRDSQCLLGVRAWDEYVYE